MLSVKFKIIFFSNCQFVLDKEKKGPQEFWLSFLSKSNVILYDEDEDKPEYDVILQLVSNLLCSFSL